MPFVLNEAGDVSLQLFDLNGKRVAEVLQPNLSAGTHQIELNMRELGIPAADYAYQLTLKNSDGVFYYSRLMTAGK